MGRVMLSIPPQFLREVDHAARLERRNRSELLREALRQYLTQRQCQSRGIPKFDPRVRQAVRLQNALARRDRKNWDSTAAIRSWRRSC